MGKATATTHTLSAVHALHLVDLVARWGIDPGALLAEHGLERRALEDPNAHLPLELHGRLLARARVLTGEPGLGVLLGLQMRISSHGWLGFAAMSSATVRDALEIAARYTPTRTSALVLRLVEQGAVAALVIEPKVPLGDAEDGLILSLLVGISQAGEALTGRALVGSADVTFPEPAYYPRFRHVLECRFGQPVNQLVFARDVLELPLVDADPGASRLALAECERALAILRGGEGMAARARRVIARPGVGFRSLDEAARALGVSSRTLKRKLAAEGATYSALIDHARREQAVLLLRGGELSLDEIAVRLGYSDAANFSRAFRRWTGTSPRHGTQA